MKGENIGKVLMPMEAKHRHSLRELGLDKLLPGILPTTSTNYRAEVNTDLTYPIKIWNGTTRVFSVATDGSIASTGIVSMYNNTGDTYAQIQMVPGSVPFPLIYFGDGMGVSDVQIGRQAAHVLRVGATVGGGDCIELWEMTAPDAPADNSARLFVQDNGAGKEQLAVRFNTGAIQIVATEP